MAPRIMLTRMTQNGSTYDVTVVPAKGYAEANPAADGRTDAARKCGYPWRASIAFNSRVGLDHVSTEGITQITPADIEYAAEPWLCGQAASGCPVW